MAAKTVIHELTGLVHTWKAFDQERKYGVITLPFGEMSNVVMPVPYNAEKGKGEQRKPTPSHIKKIKKEIENSNFTPTPISVNIRDKGQAKLLTVFEDEETKVKQFKLQVKSTDPLAQTDGSHRFGALEMIRDELKQKVEKSTNAKEKEDYERWLNQIINLPITATVYFDGDAQVDFLNLQAGRAADATHVLSLKTDKSDDPAMRRALNIGRAINAKVGGPFQARIRFDSNSLNPLPFSSIASKGSSDIGTSLVGLARVTLNREDINVEKTADMLFEAYEAINAGCPDAFNEEGQFLTLQMKNGTKGSASMLIGVWMCYCYRILTEENVDVEAVKAQLVESVSEVLNEPTGSSFSGPDKRRALGKFAKHFFESLDVDKHQGIPLELCRLLSCSTFDVETLPKEAKAAAPTPPSTPAPAKPAKSAKETKAAAPAKAEKPKKGDKKTEKPAEETEKTEAAPEETKEAAPAPAAKTGKKKTEKAPVAEPEAAPWEADDEEVAG